MSRKIFKKTKMMSSSENAGKVREEGKVGCAVCGKGVGNGSILCQFANVVRKRHVVEIEGNKKRTARLNARHKQISKQT